MQDNLHKNTVNMDEKTQNYQFRAIDQYVVSNIESPEEKDSRCGYIKWGETNYYPNSLNDLYKNVATLQAIIEGTCQFVTGNEIDVNGIEYETPINDKGESISDLITNISRDYLKYGGFAINVSRNIFGNIVGLYYIPLERIRSNEDNTVFYYSKKWDKVSQTRGKYQIYPKFREDVNDANSIYYYSNNHSNTYPTPIWAAAVKACTIEMAVNDYHLNGIKNGFSGSYMISFNNGVPDENQADEIETRVNEKFGGEQNSGRILLNFANDKEHSAELTKLDLDDVGERYKSLIERTKSEIFTAFRALPQLFGINQSTGFATQEYEEAFKLYNKTAVRPIQKIMVNTIKRLLGIDIEIVPFSLEENNIDKIETVE